MRNNPAVPRFQFKSHALNQDAAQQVARVGWVSRVDAHAVAELRVAEHDDRCALWCEAILMRVARDGGHPMHREVEPVRDREARLALALGLWPWSGLG